MDIEYIMHNGSFVSSQKTAVRRTVLINMGQMLQLPLPTVRLYGNQQQHLGLRLQTVSQ